MSHEEVLEFAGKCPVTLQTAVEALGWKWLGHKTHEQYVRRVEGYGIKIPNFYYTTIVDMDGKIRCDEDDLVSAEKRNSIDDLRKQYHIQVAKAEATARNGTFAQTVLADGSIAIDIHIGGGTAELGNDDSPKLGGTSIPAF